MMIRGLLIIAMVELAKIYNFWVLYMFSVGQGLP